MISAGTPAFHLYSNTNMFAMNAFPLETCRNACQACLLNWSDAIQPIIYCYLYYHLKYTLKIIKGNLSTSQVNIQIPAVQTQLKFAWISSFRYWLGELEAVCLHFRTLHNHNGELTGPKAAMATLQRPKVVKRLSWQDMSPASPRIHLTRRIVQLQGNKASADILEQAKQICNEYVEAKLERDGIKNRSLSVAFSNSHQEASQVSNRVQEVGELLELCYPRLYSDISSRVNVPFSSENAVHEVFNNVSSEILSDGLNWARIVALYAFAGGLVAECCKEGRNSFVLDIGNWMYEFAALYMVDWIKSRGGWVRWITFVLETEILKFILKPRMERAYEALKVYKQRTVVINANSIGFLLRL